MSIPEIDTSEACESVRRSGCRSLGDNARGEAGSVAKVVEDGGRIVSWDDSSAEPMEACAGKESVWNTSSSAGAINALGRMTGDHSGVVGCEYSVPSLLNARSKIVEGQYEVDWGEPGSE